MFGLTIPWAKIVFLVGLYLAGLASGAWATHKIDLATINKMKADYAAAQVAEAKAEFDLQRKVDQAASDAVAARAESSERLAAGLQSRLSEVERNAKALARSCVTYEFVRQLRLYIRNKPGESLAIPAGKSPSACAPISGLRLERIILEQLAIGRSNGDAYDKLSAWARSIEALRPKQ